MRTLSGSSVGSGPRGLGIRHRHGVRQALGTDDALAPAVLRRIPELDDVRLARRAQAAQVAEGMDRFGQKAPPSRGGTGAQVEQMTSGKRRPAISIVSGVHSARSEMRRWQAAQRRSGTDGLRRERGAQPLEGGAAIVL